MKYTYADKKQNRDDEDTINYLDDAQAVEQTWESHVHRTTWSKTHNFNFDYYFEDNKLLSLSSAIVWLPYFKYKIANRTQVFGVDHVPDFYYSSNNQSNHDKYNLGFDLDYVDQF